MWNWAVSILENVVILLGSVRMSSTRKNPTKLTRTITASSSYFILRTTKIISCFKDGYWTRQHYQTWMFLWFVYRFWSCVVLPCPVQSGLSEYPPNCFCLNFFGFRVRKFCWHGNDITNQYIYICFGEKEKNSGFMIWFFNISCIY